jgi:hypothetical protein
MATAKTNNNKQDNKQYLVIDNDGDILAYGTMGEIEDMLNEYNDGDDEDDELSFPEWIAQCTIHELGVGKKIKYTPAKYSF